MPHGPSMWDSRPGPHFLHTMLSSRRVHDSPTVVKKAENCNQTDSCEWQWCPQDHRGLQEPCLVFPSEGRGTRPIPVSTQQVKRCSSPYGPLCPDWLCPEKSTGWLIITLLTTVFYVPMLALVGHLELVTANRHSLRPCQAGITGAERAPG